MTERVLVRGRWLVPNADNWLSDGAVVITGDSIAEVGPWPDIRSRYPAAPVLGGDDYAVIPGLINAHHHSNGVTALQHGLPDRLLELWLLSLAQRRRIPPYPATLLSAGRLLRTGVTSVVDVYSGHGTARAFHDNVREALRAYDEAGMRVAFAAGYSEQSHLIWGEDAAFLDSLPQDARRAAELRLPYSDDHMTTDEYFAVMDQLQAHVRQHPRLSVWYGPPGPQWVLDHTLVRISEKAQEHDTGIQTHLLESVYEKYHGERSYGKSTVQYLAELGVLSPRFSFAHGVWLTEADIELLAAAGCHVSHNPGSNLRLRAGIAPLNAMLAGGLNVGLGMDGTTLNDDEDMFTEMRLALNLHRGPHLDDPAPTVEQVWRLATSGGARLFQAGNRLGQLAPGFAADVVLIRLDRLTWPWVAPEVDPRLLLLTRAKAGDVDTVLVAGQVVIRNGQPTGIDEEAAGRELHDLLAAAAVSEETREMVRTLSPHVANHYRTWGGSTLEPYDARNSRR